MRAARLLLEHWTRSATTPQRVVRRSRIVLLWMAGMPNHDIAKTLGISRPTVRLWTARFQAGGTDVLLRDAPGRGRRPRIEPQVLRTRLAEAGLLDSLGRPISLRRAAAYLGISAAAVWRSIRKSA
jgi:biotin operon repressor